MDTWIPNPNAKPYSPKGRKRTMTTLCGPFLSRRNCLIKICKACLLLVLTVTVVINITFILETNKKLKFSQSQTNDHVEDSEAIQHVQDGSDRDNAVEMRQGHHGNQHRSLSIEALSSKELVTVKVNGDVVLSRDGLESDRGIHIVVLNQVTVQTVKSDLLMESAEKGVVMALRVFDTYQGHEDDAMVQFLGRVSKGRIIIFTIKDEGSFQMKDEARKVLTDLGSVSATLLHWRDMWVFVTVNGRGRVGESLSKSPDLGSWGDQVTLRVNVPLAPLKDAECEKWLYTETNKRRRVFCNKYEGYGNICNCDQPLQIDSPKLTLEGGETVDIPVSVIASNRPQYLFRMLTKLLQTPGVPVDKITVFIDGFFDEPMDVARLLNLRAIQHTPNGVKNAKISQHYKASIKATFELFPTSEYIILIEEDLEVSPDFFNYFHQTLPLLEDKTVYCISAWNDQGYDHSCKDPSLLYRIETMPGLGWMMKKSLFIDELEPKWPSVDKLWDWDMWMRDNLIRKSRECIIPDISRTFHFGSKGLNINPYFQELYFQKHTLLSQPNVKLKDIEKMQSEPYEILIKDLIKGAKVLDHSKDPCGEDFIPHSNDETYVMYIQMKAEHDFETWKSLAKCYKLWDLDVRGFHKSMWRQFHQEKHLVIIGVPASPYAEFKPKEVTPIYLPEKKDKPKER